MSMDREQERCARRRTFLAGLVALPMIGGAPALARGGDPADAAFRRWLTGIGSYNTLTVTSDDDDDPAYIALIVEPENTVRGLAPSIMAAAAFALVEASYEFLDASTLVRRDCNAPLTHVLACLLPFLTGAVGQVAADYLDHVGKPYRDTLLSRCVSGHPLPEDQR